MMDMNRIPYYSFSGCILLGIFAFALNPSFLNINSAVLALTEPHNTSLEINQTPHNPERLEHQLREYHPPADLGFPSRREPGGTR